jgi:hypothetical protein
MMKKDKKKREKILDLIGGGCGAFLALLLLINIGSGVVAQAASANAQTLTASAPGKVGDVTVEVKADDKKIYEVKVTDHSETEGIGTMAVDQLPGKIVESQSLTVEHIGLHWTSLLLYCRCAQILHSGVLEL